MKKILFALSMLLSVTTIAQPEGRVFTVLTNQPYTNLSTPIKISDSAWDDFSAKVPLGFTFHLFGEKIDTVFFDDFSNVGADMQFRIDSNTNMIGLGFTDLTDRSNDGIHSESVISYQTVSNNNKKITKINKS